MAKARKRLATRKKASKRGKASAKPAHKTDPVASLTRSCDKGDPRACAELARRYRAGDGTPRDLAKAVQAATDGCEAGKESLATLVFRDCFALITRQALQGALDMLQSYPYPPTGHETLESIAAQFDSVKIEYTVRPGDTIATIISTFGMTARQMRSLNGGLDTYGHHDLLPTGATILVSVGVSPVTIAEANMTYPLNPGPTGTSRDLKNLVSRMVSRPLGKSTSATDSPRASRTRSPATYSSSRTARSVGSSIRVR